MGRKERLKRRRLGGVGEKYCIRAFGKRAKSVGLGDLGKKRGELGWGEKVKRGRKKREEDGIVKGEGFER